MLTPGHHGGNPRSMGGRVPLAVAALVALGQVPSAAADEPYPAYVNNEGNWAVLSNAHWKAGPAGKAKELGPGSTGISDRPGEHGPLVWAPACTKGPQKVVFSREVDVPGVPGYLSFALYPASFAPVFDYVQLRVNGQTV